MKITLLSFSLLLVFLIANLNLLAQDIELYEQFNGRYDYTAIGNTLNEAENGIGVPCTILTSSSAILSLLPSQNITAAYLYWAGSGIGDFDVELNGAPITAQRTFSYVLDINHEYFAAFSDVTTLVQNTGNGNYTLSELDLTNVIDDFCESNSTNFGGWSIVVIYEDATLPLNQVNIYDGLESVSATNQSLNINLESINVIDNQGAKIGFLAWEGDSSIAVNETLQINGNILSNPPLNPANNAFNSTNSFTNSDELWNMDIDYYIIQNYIQIGDTNATITLTSGQDLVMVNNIITVLNSQLPDATIEIDNFTGGEACGDREIIIEYTVYNVNSTAPLPEDTPIAFYANNTLIGTAATINEIPMEGSETQTIILNVPSSVPAEFILTLAVDDTGNGTGIVTEIDETNNETSYEVILLEYPVVPALPDQEKCEVVGMEAFDLTTSTAQINPDYEISFHLSLEDAENNQDSIDNPESFINTENPQTIYVRVDNGDCFIIETFTVEVIVCPLPDATIAITNDLNACRQRPLYIEFTVANIDGTAPLPAQTPIAFYADNILVATDATPVAIPVGGEINMSIGILLPENLPDVFELKLFVDDIGDGTGVVLELDETNNTFITVVTFMSIPEIPPLEDLELCNEGFGFAVFDLTLQNEFISTETGDEITYYTSFDDALEKTDSIPYPDAYQSISNPQYIYVRLENEVCFTIASFELSTKDCPPWIPEGFSPNDDNINDFFEISGLLNIFLDHEILIYSRHGNLIFRGNNKTGFWDGNANEGLLYDGPVPVGVYYYVLNLNHPDYDIFVGWVYLNK